MNHKNIFRIGWSAEWLLLPIKNVKTSGSFAITVQSIEMHSFFNLLDTCTDKD